MSDGARRALESIDAVRERLERMMLQELQTGGGLELQGISGVKWPAGTTSNHIPAIRAVVDRLRALRLRAPQRAAELLSTAEKPRDVIDIGAGLAPWSLALAARSDSVQVLALDLPEQVAELSEAIHRAGRTHQFQVAAGNVFSEAIVPPAAFDLAAFGSDAVVVELTGK